jgi:hypothetical protein
VSHQAEPVHPELVQECQHVAGEALLVVAAGWCIRPAEAAEVGHDQPVSLAQRRHQPPPHVPVLGPAVQYHQRLATTCLGDVKTDAVHFEVAVVDSGNLG